MQPVFQVPVLPQEGDELLQPLVELEQPEKPAEQL
jgi:hypothetical protein